MKVLTKLFSLLVACMLCFALCCCGGGENSSSSTDSSAVAPATEYTVYVVDPQGNPIEGVRIGICTYDESTGIKGGCLQPKNTDAEGKVVFNNTESVYIINEDLFEGEYTAQAKCVLKAYGEYTVVLTAI